MTSAWLCRFNDLKRFSDWTHGWIVAVNSLIMAHTHIVS